MQAGGRRFDPVQLHQPWQKEFIRKLLVWRLASGFCPLRGVGRNRLLFNNLEGKAFMRSDEDFMDNKG